MKLPPPTARSTLIALVATAVSLATQGYQFDTPDQAIHLTILRERLDPGGLAGDLVAAHAGAHQSLFWDLQAPLVRWMGWERLPELYLGLWAAALFASLLGLMAMARALGLGERATALGVLLLAVPRACPGHVFTWEPEFINRTATQPLLWFSLAAMLRGRPAVAGLLCGLGFNLHATTAAHTGAALGMMVLVDPGRGRRLPALIGAFALGAAPLLLQMHGGETLWVDAAWREILVARLSHHLFPQTWPPGVWAGAALQLGLLGWGLAGLAPEPRRRAIGLASGLLIVGPMLGTLTATVLPLAPLFALHLWEAWIGLVILAFLAAAHRLSRLWERGPKARLVAVAVVAALFASPEARWMGRARDRVWEPWGDAEQIVLATAVARRTSPGERVIVGPTDLAFLRWRAHRPLYVTTKDGGEAVFSRTFAMDWQARLTDLVGQDAVAGPSQDWLGYNRLRDNANRAFAKRTGDDLAALGRRTGARWMVLRADRPGPTGARRHVKTARWSLWKLALAPPDPAPRPSD